MSSFLDGLFALAAEFLQVKLVARSESSVTPPPAGSQCLILSSEADAVVAVDSTGTVRPLGGQAMRSRTAALTVRGVLEVLGARIYDALDRIRLDFGRVDFREYLDKYEIDNPSTTNCTLALQEAIDYAIANGLKLWIPPGTYVFDGVITLGKGTVGGCCYIEGCGPDNTILIARGSGRALFEAWGSGMLYRLRGFTLNANSLRDAVYAVFGLNSNMSRIEDIKLFGAKTFGGITCAPQTGSLIGCKFINCHFAGGPYAIYAQGADSLQACHFIGGRTSSLGKAFAFLRYRLNGQPDIFFSYFALEGNNGKIFDYGGGGFLCVSDSHFENNVRSDVSPYTSPENSLFGGIMSDATWTPAATGTTPPAVTIYGCKSVLESFDSIELDIVVGGALGTATFRWRPVTGGTGTWRTTQATDSSVLLDETGYYAQFPAGMYNADNAYTLSVPSVSLDGGLIGTQAVGDLSDIQIEIISAGTLPSASFRHRARGSASSGAWTDWVTPLVATGSPPTLTIAGTDTTIDLLNIKITTGGARGTSYFSYQTVTGGVASAWSTPVHTSGSLALDGSSGSGSGTATGYAVLFTAGTYTTSHSWTTANMSAGSYAIPNNQTAQFPAGTYAKGVYAFVARSTRCVYSCTNVRFGQTAYGHTNPRAYANGGHTVLNYTDCEFQNADVVSGISGSEVGSQLSLRGCPKRPTINWASNDRVVISPAPAAVTQSDPAYLLSDSATSLTIDFTDDGLPDEHNANYGVVLTPIVNAGTPTVGSYYVSNRTTGGFKINANAAPGTGNSLRFAYALVRPSL